MTMKALKSTLACIVMLAICLTACEKPFAGEDEDVEENATVILQVSNFEQLPFASNYQQARTASNVSDFCTQISFVIYQNDERVKYVNQKSSDTGFGKVGLNLEAGTYQVAVIAHSGEGSATTTNAEKITFKDNKVTDTFCYYGQIEVGTTAQTYDLDLKRCVSLFRLIISDAMPTDVAKIKFYYTGGSSTLSAKTGYGSVQSKQTVNFSIDDSMKGKGCQFEVYTIPHEETDVLKLTVTAYNSSDSVLYEKVFENVPIQRNMITQYTGEFFSSVANTSSFSLTADNNWDGTKESTY